MGVIAFSKSPEESWMVAGWAFHQLLDNVFHQQEDSELGGLTVA